MVKTSHSKYSYIINNDALNLLVLDFEVLIFIFFFILYSWAEKDVDPSLFPQELVANFYYLLEEKEVVFSNDE